MPITETESVLPISGLFFERQCTVFCAYTSAVIQQNAKQLCAVTHRYTDCEQRKWRKSEI